MHKITRGFIAGTALMSGALFARSGFEYHGMLDDVPSATAPIDAPITTTGIIGNGKGEFQCDPNIDVCAPPSEDTPNTCSALSVLRVSIERVSDEANPLVDEADRDFPEAYSISEALGLFEQTTLAEHPDMGQSTAPEDLELFAAVESIRATSEKLIETSTGDMVTVELADQARDTINLATPRFCLVSDKLAHPAGYGPGALTGSLTCEIIEVIDDETNARLRLSKQPLPEYGSTAPETPTATGSVDLEGIHNKPSFVDMATLLNVAFTNEFAGIRPSDDARQANDSIRGVVARTEALTQNTTDWQALTAAVTTARQARITYCSTEGTLDPANTYTPIPSPAPNPSNTTTTTTEAPLSEAPPATPIEDSAKVTG